MNLPTRLIVALAIVAGLAGAAMAQNPDRPTGPAAEELGGSAEDPAAPTAIPPPARGAPAPADLPATTDAAPAPTAAAGGEAEGGATLPAWIQEINNRPWDTGGNYWLPTPAALEADGSDFMFYATLGLSIFFFFGIFIATIVFVIKYRARPGHRATPSPSHNDALEITWTVIPTIIVVFLFIGGWNNYVKMNTRPAEPITIKVTAKKWSWDFEYPNGLHLQDLHVPVDRPIELQMTSVDVLHSFFVPAFRVKMDIIPRRYTYIYFTPTRPGTYRLYCTEYCGREHSLMKVKAFVHDGQTWERYLAETKAALQDMDPVALGKVVFDTKGCAACHSIDGSTKVGPTWKGAWGKDVPLAGGGTVPYDAQYVKTAIEEPQKQLHAGFPPSMPSYAGQLSEAEINGVAAYIESLK